MIPGDLVAERYELEQLVGSGGMSSVYRAHDRVLERTVALKMLHERLAAQRDIVERFSREAKLVAQLSHENIVSVIDRGEHEGNPFIVFEFIAGENLKQLVARIGPLPVEQALDLAVEIARGLTYAHREGFVHRDVKPQNVLLDARGEAKVTDFGIARTIEGTGGETVTGTVLGTCDYISPEQAQGRRVDEASDVYSLGVVLYELLTGHAPFTGENFVAVAMQHINAPPPPVTLDRPEAPARVEAAIEKALAKDPADRFESMAAFGTELQACLAEVRVGEDTSATGIMPALPPAATRREKAPRRRLGRRWKLAALLAVVLAAAAIALVLALTRNGSGGGGGGGGSTPISISALAAYDPDGDNTENPRAVARATDGNPATGWSTEHYYDRVLGKPGVGIILDAGAPVTAHSLTVVSATPGYTATIRAGNDSTGPFTDDSSPKVGGATTTFALQGHSARYYLIWITDLGGRESVEINEVTAR